MVVRPTEYQVVATRAAARAVLVSPNQAMNTGPIPNQPATTVMSLFRSPEYGS